jgi:hypothetical protein
MRVARAAAMNTSLVAGPRDAEAQTDPRAVSDLRVLESHQPFPEVRLIEPSTSGFVLIAAEIDRRPPILGSSRRKRRQLAECKALCRDLRREAGVVDAAVFRAIVVPPVKRVWFVIPYAAHEQATNGYEVHDLTVVTGDDIALATA